MTGVRRHGENDGGEIWRDVDRRSHMPKYITVCLFSVVALKAVIHLALG